MSSSEVHKQELLAALKQFRVELATYKDLVLSDRHDTMFIDTSRVFRGEAFTPVEGLRYLSTKLAQEYGVLKPVIQKYGGSAEVRLLSGSYQCDAFEAAFTPTLFDDNAFSAILDSALTAVNIAIGRIEKATLFVPLDLLEDRLTNSGKKSIPPKAFIAHGGESKALTKLCSFLEALGVKPVVADVEPSEGRLTEGQVDECMGDAACAIILATYGHIVDKNTGDKHPRLNVVDELGRCRAVFPKRTILLLQKDVELPSNVSGIVHERFTKQSMDKAFIKVARELTKFGLIRAVKVD